MVKLRLKKTGKKKSPSYQIVAIDSRKHRDASYLEKIGHYYPLKNAYDINEAKALKWLSFGAKPTDTVHNLFVKSKIIEKFLESKNKPSK